MLLPKQPHPSCGNPNSGEISKILNPSLGRKGLMLYIRHPSLRFCIGEMRTPALKLMAVKTSDDYDQEKQRSVGNGEPPLKG